MLIIFAGLPGTGKTSIAKKLAKEIGAVYMRVDTIEQELKNLDSFKHGAAAYHVGFGMAKDNLDLGITVVADSVNPVEYTRERWREVAKQSKVRFVEIETMCSDKEEHRKRVEDREIDIINFKKPTWEDIENREYEKFSIEHITIDTCKMSVNEAVEFIKKEITRRCAD